MNFLRKLTGPLGGPSHTETTAVSASGNGSGPAFPDVQAAAQDISHDTRDSDDLLQDLPAQVNGHGDATRTAEDLAARIAALENTVTSAEARADQACQRAADAEKQRELLEGLLVRAADTIAQLEALQPLDSDFAQVDKHVRAVQEESQHLLSQHNTLKQEMEILRKTMADANEHTTALRQSSLKARDTSDRAVRTVEEVQQKLEALARFDAVSRDTSAQLQAVNALAERVTSKVKAFDQQHETLEHALVESRKLNEMVRDMDAQIARLNEGSPLVTRIEETFAKLEHLQLQTTTELVEADRVRQAHSELLEQHRADTTELLETLQGRVDHLGLAKNAIDALGDRLSTAQSTLADVERRLAAVSTGDEAARNLDEKIDELSLRVGKLDAEARTLEQRQEALTALEVRLTEVEEAAKSTGRHLEGLAERRQELDALRATLTEFDAIHARGEALTNRLRADKQELAQFADRTASFMRDAPAISASVESLKRTLAEVEESAGRATGMKPMVDELASQAERLAARLQITKDLQARLDELHALSVEVDQKLTRQLARQAEIEAVRIACDGLSTRLTDAQHNYATLTAAQGKLASLPGQIAELEKSVGVARSEVLRLQHEEVLPAQAQMLKDRTSQYAP